MGKLIRGFDWAGTPVGPVEHWPQSLKTALRIMLTSRQPIWIGWGRELIYFYNDAYQSIIGGRHPWALGQPTSAVWREIWEEIGPMLSTAMSGDEGTYVEEQLLIMERNGYPEETYYTFSYSPIPDDTGGAGGIICANTEDTGRMIGERQVALLRELAADTVEARTLQEACDRSACALETDPHDVPFAMIYMAEPDGRHLSLAGAAGIPPGHPAAPQRVALGDPCDWPFAEVMSTHAVSLVRGLVDVFGDGLPSGAWRRAPAQAAVLPIHSSGEAGRSGCLVVGLNPFRLFDDSYQGFLGLVAGQIAASIANAEAYEQEKKRAEELAELDRAKTAFFSNVSHEFRTPLTLMLGPVEDMLSPNHTELSPAVKAQLEVVNRNGLRLLRLVNTLLDFSRIEAGRARAVFRPTDLAGLTVDLASVFRSAVERAGIRLEVDCPPLSQPVYLDRDMYEKVVLNLLSNAFKYTFEGEIAVTLRQVGDTAELRVRDTGTGIPAEEMPRLFERFHRVENARGRTHEGSGIGLALVQELVRLHRGTVGAESVVGQGTTFTVALPLGTAHLPADQLGQGRSAAATSTGAAPYVEEALRWMPSGDGDAGYETPSYPQGGFAPDGSPEMEEDDGRPRVLVADDNADMRQYVARVLSEQYRVETVPDGAAALAAVRRQLPDLVLTDVMMPRMDGFGLLRELRADPPTSGLPVILLSARAGEESRVEGMQSGADDYLVKPFSARELVARVTAHVEMARVRRDASEKLRESEERYRLATRATHDVVWDWDLASDAVVWSEALHTVFGYPPEQAGTAINDALGWWTERIHPEDRERVGASFSQAAAAGQAQWIEDYRFRRADGSYAEVTDAAFIVFDAGRKPVRMVGAMSDITQRKRDEEALRRRHAQFETLINAAPLGVFLVEGDFRIRQVNPTARPTFGDIPDLIGSDFEGVIRRLWPPAYADEVVRLFRHTLETGEPYVTPERAERRLDRGVTEYYEWQIHRIQLPEGGFGVVCYFRDISAQVLARAAMAESEERLRQAAKMEAVGRLAGGIAHDFNNQLHGVSGFANFVAQDPGLGARARQDLDEVQKATERMAGLTRQLLAFSRQQVLQPETLDLNAAVTDGQSLLHRLIGSAVQMELHLVAEPLWVRADRAQLLQVLMNLTINARDAMPSGGGLLVRTGRRTVAGHQPGQAIPTGDIQPGSYVELTVTDTGTGIAPENLPHIFEPFFTTKVVGEGTGLGLATVHGIVSQSHGHVWAESHEGDGTTFTVLLPAAIQPAVPGGHPPPAPAHGSRPARLLVVDDEEIVRITVARTLEAEGYEVLQARHGGEALEQLARHGAVDLIVSDVVMPVLGGRGLGERLAADYPGVAVAWMSGYPRDSAFGGKQVADAHAFLQKPIPPDVLISTVRDILARR